MLLTIAFLGAVLPCRADLVQTKGSARLAIQPATAAIALADTITVTLTVDGTPALRVDAPLDLPRSAKWQLVERTKPDREAMGPDQVRWRIVYRFAPREPGEIVFAFPDVKFRDRDDQDQSASWDPVVFTVKTKITQLDRAATRGVADIESLPTVTPVASMWPAWTTLAAVVAIMTGIGFGWRYWVWRRMPKTPAAWAQGELDRLLTLRLPEHRRSERFITLLSLLLRRYLEKQFHLLARRQTTPEFLQHLNMQAEFTDEEKRFLTTFLSRCDAVKFAGIEMPTDECHRWAAATGQFLKRSDGEVAQAG